MPFSFDLDLFHVLTEQGEARGTEQAFLVELCDNPSLLGRETIQVEEVVGAFALASRIVRIAALPQVEKVVKGL